MSQPEVKTESASSSHSRGDSQIPELDLPLRRAELIARPAPSQRPRTAPPPPPPMAAYSVRPSRLAAGPELIASRASQEGWSELAPNPSFIALSQAPQAPSRNWPNVVAISAGTVALLAAGYLAGITRWSSTPTLTSVSQAEHIIVKPLPAEQPAAVVSAHNVDTAALAKPLTAAPILTSIAPAAPMPELSHAEMVASDKANATVESTAPAAPMPLPVVRQPQATATQEPATAAVPAGPEAPPVPSEPQAAEVTLPAAAEANTPAVAAEAANTARDAPAASGESDLPELPTREAVKESLENVRARLATCAGSGHGTSFASVTIAGSGRATYSTIEGAFSGTPAGSCMARALRTAPFPKFSAPSFKVRYPFVF